MGGEKAWGEAPKCAPGPAVAKINEAQPAGMLPLQGRTLFPSKTQGGALALALVGYGIQPRRGLRAGEYAHFGSAEGAAIQPRKENEKT